MYDIGRNPGDEFDPVPTQVNYVNSFDPDFGDTRDDKGMPCHGGIDYRERTACRERTARRVPPMYEVIKSISRPDNYPYLLDLYSTEPLRYLLGSDGLIHATSHSSRIRVGNSILSVFSPEVFTTENGPRTRHFFVNMSESVGGTDSILNFAELYKACDELLSGVPDGVPFIISFPLNGRMYNVFATIIDGHITSHIVKGGLMKNQPSQTTYPEYTELMKSLYHAIILSLEDQTIDIKSMVLGYVTSVTMGYKPRSILSLTFVNPVDVEAVRGFSRLLGVEEGSSDFDVIEEKVYSQPKIPGFNIPLTPDQMKDILQAYS